MAVYLPKMAATMVGSMLYVVEFQVFLSDLFLRNSFHAKVAEIKHFQKLIGLL